MKCQEFENNLAEFVAGRLPAALQGSMRTHTVSCSACGRKEGEEREFRNLFQAFPPVAESPDLWYRLESQLKPEARRAPFKWPWVYGGAAMAFAACAAALLLQIGRPIIPTETRTGTYIDAKAEQKMVQLVRENRKLRTVDSEALVSNLQSTGEAESAVLLGGSQQ